MGASFCFDMKQYIIEWESYLISGHERHKPDDYSQRVVCGGESRLLAYTPKDAENRWLKLFKRDKVLSVREAK